MSAPYLGEVRMIGFNFAPRNWALCDGQILSISQNQSLYSLLGTMYGGDGRTTFGLPELRGRVPIHTGQGPGLTNRDLGSKVGEETVTLTTTTMPAHNHTANTKVADGQGNSFGARSNFLATQAVDVDVNPKTTVEIYKIASSATFNLNATLNGVQINNNGSGNAHNNMQPYLTINYIICLSGIFPPRN